MRYAVVLLVVGCLLSAASAQTDWAKYDSNPVFVKWGLMEAYAIGQPTNLYRNDTFQMWYAACALDHRGRIFRANSPDGIHWARANLGLPVLDLGPAGSWDSKWLDTPEVLRDQTGYQMLYYGDTTDQPAPVGGLGSALGLATSANGLAWTKDSANPVFENDTAVPWQNLWVESPALLLVDDTLRMWYSAVAYEAGNMLVRTGYAWSSDGRVWNRHPTPVVDLGAPGSFDDLWVATPAVIRRDSLYEMWYSGTSFADLAANDTIDTVRIGFATSRDGVHWEKFAGNPVLSTFSPPYQPEVDHGGPWAPDVVFDGISYHMWYETSAGFSYARAPLVTVRESPAGSATRPELAVWPNPCRGVLFRANSPSANSSPGRLLDAAGREVLALRPGANDVSGLSPGVYFVRERLAVGGERSAVNKVVITK
jgi:hypothetical protein